MYICCWWGHQQRGETYTIKEWYQVIFHWLSLLDVNTEVLLILMMAVAVINMISALMIIILERTNMIGILKALGSSNWDIQKIFLNNVAYLIGFGLVRQYRRCRIRGISTANQLFRTRPNFVLYEVCAGRVKHS